jgi:predicted dehydrogenase
MLNNYGAHAIDQQLAIIGYDVRRVFCGLQRVASLGDAEDVVKIVLETTDGVIGDIDICQASVIKPYRLTVWGTHGALWLENDVFKIRWFDPKKLPRKRLDCHLASAGRQYPSDAIKFREEQIAVDPRYGVDVYADFARAIRRGVPPLVKPEETLSVMRVIERCRKDAGGITAMK